MEEIPFFLDSISTLYGQRPCALTPLRRRYPMGKLLCHLDQRHHFAEGVTPQYQPDPQRIAAVIQGYTRWRHLLFEEREVLLEAVRFSSAWRGAWFFSLVEKSGLTVSLENALRNWQQWYLISEEITRLALELIERR